MPHSAVKKMVNYERKSSFINGFVIGFIVGAAAGLLAWVMK